VCVCAVNNIEKSLQSSNLVSDVHATTNSAFMGALKPESGKRSTRILTQILIPLTYAQKI